MHSVAQGWTRVAHVYFVVRPRAEGTSVLESGSLPEHKSRCFTSPSVPYRPALSKGCLNPGSKDSRDFASSSSTFPFVCRGSGGEAHDPEWYQANVRTGLPDFLTKPCVLNLCLPPNKFRECVWWLHCFPYMTPMRYAFFRTMTKRR